MDITLIGHICKDKVLLPGMDQPSSVQYGGIVYAVAAMSGVSNGKDTIHPVFGVGSEDLEEVKQLLGSFPGVDTSHIYPVKGRTNEVTLIYGSPETPRIECSEHISEPIPFAKIRPVLDADGILLNMVSGSDITLETLDTIRMAVRDSRTPVHFDFHSLTLGIQKKGKRFRRPLTDWRRWCFFLHSIQMSEEEAHGLTAERLDEPALIHQLMSVMVNVLLITRGPNGVTVVEQDPHKRLTRTDIPGVLTDTRDTTGCGDVFGAVYLRSLIGKMSPVDAARRANEVAALHASLDVGGKPSLLLKALGRTTPAEAASAP